MHLRAAAHPAALLRSERVLRLAGLLVGAGSLAAVYGVVHLTGGTPNPLVHLAYVSIIITAVAGGPWGGVLAGIAGGLLFGPLMPDSTAASATVLAQWGWLVRLLVYTAAGLLVAQSWSWARRMGRSEAARQGMRQIINVVAREKTSLAACRRLLAELARWQPTLAASVYVFEPDGTAYLLAGWSAPGVEVRRREHHTGDSAAALHRAGRGPLQRRPVSSVVLPPASATSLVEHGARSELVIPLAVDGVPVGAMFLTGPHEPEPVTDIEREALGELANAAGALVHRARQEEHTAGRQAADLVRDILDHPQLLEPAFQPIVSLTAGAAAGYEALARFRSDLAEAPNVWFERAALAGLSAELQALAIRRAREVASATRLPVGSFLSINVSPGLLGDAFVRAALTGDLRALVIELTEEEAIADYGPLRSVMAEYRNRGARFAIDDAGAGYASMRHVTELRPDFVKLDARIVTGLAGDDGRQALVRAMQGFAHDIGATLVAEGVETGQELALLADTGLPILVQGYAVARPGAPWPKVAPLAAPRGEPTTSRAAKRRPVARQQRQQLRPQRSDLR